MVTTEVDREDAGRYGVVQADGERVTGYEYKPEEPEDNLVANEVFVFRPELLLSSLEELVEESGEDDLHDLGHEVLPRLVDAGGARAHRFGGFWRDAGTVEAYWSCHQELLEEPPPIELDAPDWPVLTHAAARRASAHVAAGASVEQSMLAPAARVAGTVERSVVGRGVVVESDAVVRNSVLLPGAVVRRGATVQHAIVDDEVEVGAGAAVGEPGGEIALVGLRAAVPEDAVIGAGGRYPEVD
jgi:glucose-1-phosphate adenylyltransferase